MHTGRIEGRKSRVCEEREGKVKKWKAALFTTVRRTPMLKTMINFPFENREIEKYKEQCARMKGESEGMPNVKTMRKGYALHCGYNRISFRQPL